MRGRLPAKGAGSLEDSCTAVLGQWQASALLLPSQVHVEYHKADNCTAGWASGRDQLYCY